MDSKTDVINTLVSHLVEKGIVSTAKKSKVFNILNQALSEIEDQSGITLDFSPVQIEAEGDYICQSHCPECGADGLNGETIDWQLEADSPCYYKGICQNCGCVFHEILKYERTVVIEKGKNEKSNY